MQIIRYAINIVLRRKLRTVLTSLGITIAVVLVSFIIFGMQDLQNLLVSEFSSRFKPNEIIITTFDFNMFSMGGGGQAGGEEEKEAVIVTQEVLEEIEVTAVDGIVLDLGLSSDQLADPERGFSFSVEGPLDLRFDPLSGQPASQLVNRLSAEALADLIYAYGEERHSRRIGRAIVARRREKRIETAQDLAAIVRRCVPRGRGPQRIDPATRTFQALRIAVNEELKSLEIALRRLPDCLKPGGRIAIISFHSLEDRRVKEAFRDDPRLNPLTIKPIRPEEDETNENPRARSAKLRVAERT